ncbi:MAG: hypothetical protein ACK55Z_14980, partial [bacterium]
TECSATSPLAAQKRVGKFPLKTVSTSLTGMRKKRLRCLTTTRKKFSFFVPSAPRLSTTLLRQRMTS